MTSPRNVTVKTADLEAVIKAAHRLSPRSKQLYLKIIESYVADFGPTVTADSLEAWRDSLVTDGKQPQTVNNYLYAIRCATARLSRRMGDETLHVGRLVEPLAEKERKEKKPLSLHDARKLIPGGARRMDAELVERTVGFAGLRDRAMLICSLRTGLRRRELCRWQTETYDERSVQVTLKGGKGHRVLLDSECQEVLGQWVDRLRSLGVDSGAIWRSISRPQADDRITLGSALTEQGWWKIVAKHADRAGLKDVHPHLFRHTFITWCRQAKIPDWRIAQATGHSIRGSSMVPMLDGYTGTEDRAVAEDLPRILEE